MIQSDLAEILLSSRADPASLMQINSDAAVRKMQLGAQDRLQVYEEAKEKTAGAYPDITPQLTGKYAR